MTYSSNKPAGVKGAGHSGGGFLLTHSSLVMLLVSMVKTKANRKISGT